MDDNKFVDINAKIYSIINDDKKGFWYNLGASVVGPLYTGLIREKSFLPFKRWL